MQKNTIVVFTLFFLTQLVIAQDHPAYTLYNQKGKKVKYEKMLKQIAKSDMLFFGEYHDNPISHWLQLEVANDLYKLKGDSLFFGAEMFENGNQLVINEYLNGFYDEKKMLPEITQLWKNYKTDYKPLLDFAKENHLRFIATNIPRRYASILYKKGLSALQELSPEANKMIGADLQKYFDPTVSCYANMAKSMGGHVPPNMYNMQLAQAAKDATMAQFSVQNFKKGDLLLHFNGSYHSNYKQGIVWWIYKTNPNLEIKTITTLYESEWKEMPDENRQTIADYIVVVSDNMTKTK